MLNPKFYNFEHEELYKLELYVNLNQFQQNLPRHYEVVFNVFKNMKAMQQK